MYMKLQNIMVAALLLTAAIPSIYARQTDDGRHRYAIVNLSVNFLREGPDYTAELGTQALMGDVVRIIGEDGYWRQVITEEPYTAWCTDLGLVELDASELEEYRAFIHSFMPTGKPSSSKLNVFFAGQEKTGRIISRT